MITYDDREPTSLLFLLHFLVAFCSDTLRPVHFPLTHPSTLNEQIQSSRPSQAGIVSVEKIPTRNPDPPGLFAASMLWLHACSASPCLCTHPPPLPPLPSPSTQDANRRLQAIADGGLCRTFSRMIEGFESILGSDKTTKEVKIRPACAGQLLATSLTLAAPYCIREHQQILVHECRCVSRVMQIDHRAVPPQITTSISEVLLANRWATLGILSLRPTLNQLGFCGFLVPSSLS
ncbi:uncharacterized protein N7459_001692 [Penicillium hispanicum]|uniref:uncharacterized protein n=1 Tax=Penicillium hispanicum TaxID=1080232 RepID=UPI002542455F|nr:uncharacterized protein N7459_001692 [Penicillium hispanicum]KAJ5595484.1 hypothetical protein N7459_001692 [Penicillium hispanicum]